MDTPDKNKSELERFIETLTKDRNAWAYLDEETKEVKTCSLGEALVKNAGVSVKIAKTRVGDYVISTIFLGHNYGWHGRDLWFETMIFDEGPNAEAWHDLDQRRYETYTEALEGHREMVERVIEMEKERHDRRP